MIQVSCYRSPTSLSPCIMCVQYIGGYHENIGGYHENIGGHHEYIGGCSVHRGDIMMHVGEQVGEKLSISIENPDVLNIP